MDRAKAFWRLYTNMYPVKNDRFQKAIGCDTSFRCLGDPRRHHHTVTPTCLRVVWPYGVPSLPSLRGRAPVHAERQRRGTVVAVLRRARRLPARSRRRRRCHRRRSDVTRGARWWWDRGGRICQGVAPTILVSLLLGWKLEGSEGS